jgi:predicted dehydrogenase
MTSVSRPLRFGLVGTGYWARVTHAPALATTGHPCDVRFGREVGRVLAEAQRQIDGRAR